MNFIIPPQAVFFYKGKWTPEMDAMLLSTLITLRRGREWEDGNVPEDVPRNVRDVIMHPFGMDLTTDDIAGRVKLLKARYISFKKLVKTNGVQWNPQHKIVFASDSTWNFIFKVAGCFGHGIFLSGRTRFSLLASFFGQFDVKVEFPQEVIAISDNSAEVIVISDSDVPDAPNRVQPIYSTSDSDEVTSPMPAPSWRHLPK
ncbi:hypothetical protein SASPL_128455 [Salvia splendens]|uniref:Myb/SANT-like domain-containing protein n=1 Tax=Salvia splendens TaxID=180675 RepID=A0A8X8ZMI0_SALSN|nr:hypothetical protein SASPL_128455 [Salvia splendens]